MSIQTSWYQSNHCLTFFLKPFAWLFRFITATRRLLYRLKLKKSTRLPVPVIVVGNITVGGTGKTPLVAWLANTLKAEGKSPGIISRGFQGKATEWPQRVDVNSDPVLVGDEPVLLAHRTQCPIVVGPNRVAAGTTLLKNFDCDVLISDDGLQHYAMERDIEIVVVDGARYFGNRLCLPAGPLREPLTRLRAVDFIVCNGGNEPGWFAMELEPGDVINVADSTKRLSLAECSGHQWQALAGIGHPERFFLQLENLGFNIQSHPYPDHHHFSKKDIEFGNDFVIMTEKDAVKCRSFSDHRHWYLPVTAKLSSEFATALLAILKKGSVSFA